MVKQRHNNPTPGLLLPGSHALLVSPSPTTSKPQNENPAVISASSFVSSTRQQILPKGRFVKDSLAHIWNSFFFFFWKGQLRAPALSLGTASSAVRRNGSCCDAHSSYRELFS